MQADPLEIASLPPQGGWLCPVGSRRPAASIAPEIRSRHRSIGWSSASTRSSRRFDRSLPGDLCRAAARTVTTVYRAACGRPDALPGMVGAIQTFGQLIHAHPHIHALVTEGVFLPEGTFLPLPKLATEPFLKLWEQEVFALLVRGNPHKQIAYELGISDRTVKLHRHQLIQKLQVHSLAEAAVIAQRLGLLPHGGTVADAVAAHVERSAPNTPR